VCNGYGCPFYSSAADRAHSSLIPEIDANLRVAVDGMDPVPPAQPGSVHDHSRCRWFGAGRAQHQVGSLCWWPLTVNPAGPQHLEDPVKRQLVEGLPRSGR
jgi:hypothetical protein